MGSSGLLRHINNAAWFGCSSFSRNTLWKDCSQRSAGVVGYGAESDIDIGGNGERRLLARLGCETSSLSTSFQFFQYCSTLQPRRSCFFLRCRRLDPFRPVPCSTGVQLLLRSSAALRLSGCRAPRNGSASLRPYPVFCRSRGGRDPWCAGPVYSTRDFAHGTS